LFSPDFYDKQIIIIPRKFSKYGSFKGMTLLSFRGGKRILHQVTFTTCLEALWAGYGVGAR
jgi:hypothetical protein